MGFALRSGLSYCHVAGRTVFLDVENDRFFCLGDAAQATIAALEASVSCPNGVAEAAARLAGKGLLVERPGANAVAPCTSPQIAQSSLLDRELSPPRWRIAEAMAGLISARSALKLLGLRRVVRRLERRKQAPSAPADPQLVDDTGAAFHHAALVMTPLDQCVPRSLALANGLVARGAWPEMVIGVRLHPFAAHAWVQLGTDLLNERADVVREFTPVRVI